ncbi:unnamed protein product, partial [Owenia fusiformis]
FKMSASRRSRPKHQVSKETLKRLVSDQAKEESLKSKVKQQSQDDDASSWTPTTGTTFKALLSIRLSAAMWSTITDCDETYNYWEPTHYLLFKSGFQTWEYSPEYAIRSYAYLWLQALPLHIYRTLVPSTKIVLFYMMRCMFALLCTLAEVYFYRGVCKAFGANVGRITIGFMVLSAGMYISCTAYLPSTFTMYMTLLAFGGWFHRHNQVAISAVAASALLGWPFAGALGVPIALDLLFREKKWFYFFKWAVISGISCLAFLVQVDSYHYGKTVIAPLNIAFLVQVDSYHYGKTVIAPLNIVLYNVFSEHGPNIYGVEPWYFYFINGFLNFNIIFFMALVVLPFSLMVRAITQHKTGESKPLWLSTSALYIWVLIFFTRPHKEERFLFPIYPLICLCGAVTLEHIQYMWSYLSNKKPSHISGLQLSSGSMWLAGLCIIGSSVLSAARVGAIYNGYSAPLNIYLDLNRAANDPAVHTLPHGKTVNVCVGKEWYRFYSYSAPLNIYLDLNRAANDPAVHTLPHGKTAKVCVGKEWYRFYSYSAPLNIYLDLNRAANDPAVHTLPHGKTVNVCVGKEWYRFYSYSAPLNIYLDLNRAANDPAVHTLPHGKTVNVCVGKEWAANDPAVHTLPHGKTVNVCVGKEWYRFYSNFFLPDEHWQMHFLQSEFKGQLPSKYGPGNNATSIIPTHMNDKNTEETSRYFEVNKCHYLIDVDLGSYTDLEPQYSAQPEWQFEVNKCHYLIDVDLGSYTDLEPQYSAQPEWQVLSSSPFLHASKSHPLLRAFYIPILSDMYSTYGQYHLLKTTRTKKTKNNQS